MGEYITCWEQNRYNYDGYVDPNWMNDPRYRANGGQGDVCDHETNGEIRDMCYFQTYLVMKDGIINVCIIMIVQKRIQ